MQSSDSKLLSRISNGNWVPVTAEKEDLYINQVLERESWVAPRVGREPMTTKTEVLEFLKTGKTLNRGDDWYAQIKYSVPTPPATHTVVMVNCDCGHTIPSTSVMSSSTGTCCPDCYDKMSW